MLVPLSWLREFVPIPANTADLVERLTVAGLESAGVNLFGLPTPAGLSVKPEAAGLVWDRDKVLVAKVLRIEKHPDADKLKLVTVDYGAAEPKTVVTGAPNIAPGQSGMKVVLGLRGTRYFYQDKEGKRAVFTLEPKALRGIMNDAMCMSDYELGISEDHEGIIILDDADPPLGTPIQDVLGEVVLELDVLPNMARCLGLLGVAREVAALTGGTVTEPDLTYPTAKDSVHGKVKVEIADPQLCPRYSAAVIRNVTVGLAPRWMRSRLRYAGMRAINNVVDVTNSVMLEYGQPLHAFDYDQLVRRAGGKLPTIIVRPAKPGERLKTLDGQERELLPSDLVIADTAGPIALAGVMGGAETEVSASTTTVLLEAAAFDPVSVRKTSRRLNLFSEASGRFSRGIHPEVVASAAHRACQLLHRHAGGEVLAGIADNYPAPPPSQVIDLNKSDIRRLLGIEMPEAEIERVLTALQFEIEETMWGWKVTAPPTRLDIQSGPADLIEELARVSGYDRLPESRLAQELPDQRGNRFTELEEAARDSLVAAGLQEVITYSLSSPDAESRLDPNRSLTTAAEKPLPIAVTALGEVVARNVALLNPISPERSVLRTSLLPGVLEVVAENLKNSAGVAVFEVGPVFLAKLGDALPGEPRRLAVVIAGRRDPETWDDLSGAKPAAFDFFDLKGIVEGLLADLHVTGATIVPAKDLSHLHPGRSARYILNGSAIGTLGELHPKVAAAFKLTGPVLACELDLEATLAAVPSRFAYLPISPFPPVLRDVAAVVPEDVPAGRVLAEVTAAGGDLLEAARLFDVYRGDSIPPGTKSLAFAISYRVVDRQLADKEVDKAHQKIEGRLRHVLNAKIRGKDGV